MHKNAIDSDQTDLQVYNVNFFCGSPEGRKKERVQYFQQ